LNGRKTSVLRTISILVLRVLKWLEFPSVSYIYLPEPVFMAGCVLANGDWWVESSAHPVLPNLLKTFTVTLISDPVIVHSIPYHLFSVGLGI
jgi:hypothetical protein